MKKAIARRLGHFQGFVRHFPVFVCAGQSAVSEETRRSGKAPFRRNGAFAWIWVVDAGKATMNCMEYGTKNPETILLLHGGGLSLGGQIAVEILSQRPEICKAALIESALVKPMKLTHALIKPTFGMSYGLIKQKWFAKLQAAYLGIPQKLFDDYYRDTCRISKENMIAFLQSNSAYSPKPALRDTQAKVHIVFGSKEQPSIRASGKRLSEWIPGNVLEILAGYHHGDLSLNHPEQYAQKLRLLISKID